MKMQLKMTDVYGSVVEYKEVNSADANVIQLADQFAQANPDLWVTVTSNEPGNNDLASLMPENMKRDEALVQADEMDFKVYLAKWYPGNKDFTIKDELDLDTDTLDGAMFADLEDYEINYGDI